jgi:hypothetical protein
MWPRKPSVLGQPAQPSFDMGRVWWRPDSRLIDADRPWRLCAERDETRGWVVSDCILVRIQVGPLSSRDSCPQYPVLWVLWEVYILQCPPRAIAVRLDLTFPRPAAFSLFVAGHTNIDHAYQLYYQSVSPQRNVPSLPTGPEPQTCVPPTVNVKSPKRRTCCTRLSFDR